MKEELGTAGVAIALAILLCLLIGISVAIYPGWVKAWEFMDKNFLLSKEAPAWIQAFGSIFAIVGAYWISGTAIRKTDERQRRVILESELEFIRAARHVTKRAVRELGEMSEAFGEWVRFGRFTEGYSERLRHIAASCDVLLGKNIGSDVINPLIDVRGSAIVVKQELESQKARATVPGMQNIAQVVISYNLCKKALEDIEVAIRKRELRLLSSNGIWALESGHGK